MKTSEIAEAIKALQEQVMYNNQYSDEQSRRIVILAKDKIETLIKLL